MSNQVDLDAAFRDGTVFSASRDDRERFLQVLGHINVNGESHQIRAVNRTLVLNYLQMEDVIRELETTITKLNTENGKVATRIYWLTWAAVGLGVVQVFGVIRPIFWPDQPMVVEHHHHDHSGNQNIKNNDRQHSPKINEANKSRHGNP